MEWFCIFFSPFFPIYLCNFSVFHFIEQTEKKGGMNNPCTQQPVCGWTLSTDLHSETSAHYLLWSSPHSPSPPRPVSGADWDTECGSSPRRPQNFGGGFLFMLILLSFQHWPQLCQMSSPPAQSVLVQDSLTLLLSQFHLCFLLALRVSDSKA